MLICGESLQKFNYFCAGHFVALYLYYLGIFVDSRLPSPRIQGGEVPQHEWDVCCIKEQTHICYTTQVPADTHLPHYSGTSRHTSVTLLRYQQTHICHTSQVPADAHLPHYLGTSRRTSATLLRYQQAHICHTSQVPADAHLPHYLGTSRRTSATLLRYQQAHICHTSTSRQIGKSFFLQKRKYCTFILKPVQEREQKIAEFK
jgi:hypothetical protein